MICSKPEQFRFLLIASQIIESYKNKSQKLDLKSTKSPSENCIVLTGIKGQIHVLHQIYFIFVKKNRFRFFELFSELRKSYELRFGEQVSRIKCYLNFENRTWIFNILVSFSSKTMKSGPNSIENVANSQGYWWISLCKPLVE